MEIILELKPKINLNIYYLDYIRDNLFIILHTQSRGKKSILLNFNKNNIRYIRVWLLFYDKKKDINNDDRNIFG